MGVCIFQFGFAQNILVRAGNTSKRSPAKSYIRENLDSQRVPIRSLTLPLSKKLGAWINFCKLTPNLSAIVLLESTLQALSTHL